MSGKVLRPGDRRAPRSGNNDFGEMLIASTEEHVRSAESIGHGCREHVQLSGPHHLLQLRPVLCRHRLHA